MSHILIVDDEPLGRRDFLRRAAACFALIPLASKYWSGVQGSGSVADSQSESLLTIWRVDGPTHIETVGPTGLRVAGRELFDEWMLERDEAVLFRDATANSVRVETVNNGRSHTQCEVHRASPARRRRWLVGDLNEGATLMENGELVHPDLISHLDSRELLKVLDWLTGLDDVELRQLAGSAEGGSTKGAGSCSDVRARRASDEISVSCNDRPGNVSVGFEEDGRKEVALR